MLESLDQRADRLLEAWVRELGDGKPGMYPATALDGNLALTETRNYRSKRRYIRKNGEIVWLSYNPVAAKETRRSHRVQLMVSSDAEQAEAIMARIKSVDSEAYQALFLSYRMPSLRHVAKALKCGYGKARELRQRGHSMFCVMLEDS